MSSAIYNTLFSKNRKIFVLLIDPEKQTAVSLKKTIELASSCEVDMILVGGSLTSQPFDETIQLVKQITSTPVVLFPGNLMQLSAKADGVLLLSLISGRNPEYLIGNHVLASRFLKQSAIEIIPTGYILIDGHNSSSVEYMSNTRPIPQEKTDIIVATALAGEQLGLRMIYLEAGSGARSYVDAETVKQVKKNISIPLIVGGGIRHAADIRSLYNSGADGIVVGTAVENNHNLLPELSSVKKEFER
jgi:phosphoglycerol geranylgeranyltransferase